MVINMEYGSTIPPKKKLQMTNADEDDIISSKLPESHISHILSLLPTKDAVRTCVLSKRWINRWKSITKLDLDDNVFFNIFPVCSFCSAICKPYFYTCDKYGFILCSSCCFRDKYPRAGVVFSDFRRETKRKTTTCTEKNQFVNFLSRAILLNSTPMERFSLVIHNKYDTSLLNTWISNILNRRVKYFRIHSSNYLVVHFSALTSEYLFNSASLEELELVFNVFSIIKVAAGSIRFGHLRFLKLFNVSFEIDPSSDKNLILSLPVLKKFEIKDFTWLSGKNVIVEAPLLESISIEDEVHNKFTSYDDSIKFNTLHLKEFTYCGCYISHQIHLSAGGNFLSLASAKIIFQRWYKNSPVVSQALSFLLLQQLHLVKCMEFEGSKVLSQSKVSTLPVLAKLSHLELRYVSVEVLLSLLQKSPVLQKLVLKEIPRFPKKLLSSAAVPDCLATTVQVVKFEKVNGDKHKLFLANFFIENGKMLEKMEFSLASQSLDKAFMEKLYSFKKGFSSCSVEFSYA